MSMWPATATAQYDGTTVKIRVQLVTTKIPKPVTFAALINLFKNGAHLGHNNLKLKFLTIKR